MTVYRDSGISSSEQPALEYGLVIDARGRLGYDIARSYVLIEERVVYLMNSSTYLIVPKEQSASVTVMGS